MSIKLIQGDITQIKVDAIVNAANTSLLGGGGVDGAIHRAAGRELLEACQKIRNKQGGCKIGKAVTTIAGRLPAKFVIHTVGPVWNEGAKNETKLLRQCYLNCLKQALIFKVNTISFPSISTGRYKFPYEIAAEIAISEVIKFKEKFSIEVNFVCFDRTNFEVYNSILKSSN